jgi:predicted amidohydrolase
MRIGIGQTNPQKGDIEKNIVQHIKLLNIAIHRNADLMFFPELSLTGYEPELAKDLATTSNDKRLDVFQEICDLNKIVIGVGLPTKENDNLFISMIIFQPKRERVTYSKQYLYSTQVCYFTPGQKQIYLNVGDSIVAPAICYDLSNPEHSKKAYEENANIYNASVLSDVDDIESDIKKLSAIACKYEMIVFMANFIGQSGGFECAGKSSVWDTTGKLIGQLDTETEGILIYDTETKEIVTKTE